MLIAAVAVALSLATVFSVGLGLSADPGSFKRSFDLHAFPAFIRRGLSEARARKMIAVMPDEEILAQTLMVGYRGAEPPAEMLEWIGQRGIGGIKIFGWNAEDTTALARAVSLLQARSLDSVRGIPTLVATDQEGGWIRHVKGRSSESPGNMAIGATSSSRDAYLAGFFLGTELRSLGIFMNFAPVVDVATELSSGIIGPRAFSSDPATVARLGEAFARGSLAAGVIPTAKHYPGHGATKRDSHGVLPVIDVERKTFRIRELLPFSRLSRSYIPAIMSGHLVFPGVAPDETPASLSRFFISDLLKGSLGYRGLVITDDLYMVGAIGEGTILEAAIKALEAGNDMILLSTAPSSSGSLWLGLKARYKADSKFRARVRDAATKVMAAKLNFLRPLGRDTLVPDPERVNSLLPDPGARKFFRDLARRSVTNLGARTGLPFKPKGRVLLAAPFDTFLRLGRERYVDSVEYRFSYRPESQALPDELAAFKARLSGCSGAIVAVANAAGLEFARVAGEAGVKVAIVSVLSPAQVLGAKLADASVAVYHYAPDCLEAGLDALAGKLIPRGRLPITLPKKR
jgi:beta-N-acetylhexosaminidase